MVNIYIDTFSFTYIHPNQIQKAGIPYQTSPSLIKEFLINDTILYSSYKMQYTVTLAFSILYYSLLCVECSCILFILYVCTIQRIKVIKNVQ